MAGENKGDLWYTVDMCVEKGKNDGYGHEAVCFFAAMCMFLSAVEYAIPKPFPFLRIGLANLPLIIALDFFSFRECLLLSLLKVFTQALISGTLFSYVFVFSFLGTFSSVISMYAVRIVAGDRVSHVGVSLAGSMANCLMQVFLCAVMLFGENTRFVAPLLLSFGFVSGICLGLVANVFCAKSRWISLVEGYRKVDCTGDSHGEEIDGRCSVFAERSVLQVSLNVFKVIVFVVGMLFISFVDDVKLEWTVVGLLFLMCFIFRRGKVKVLPSLFIVAGIVGFECIITNGRLLISIVGWNITEGSVLRGLLKSGRLIGMVFASQILLSGKFLFRGRVGLEFQRVQNSFKVLTSSKIKLRDGNVISQIDKRLCDSWVQIVGNVQDGDSL